MSSAVDAADAPSLDAQRAAVVKVTAVVDGKRKTGTGFIVRLEAGVAYIVTAAHVVEGDKHPRVEFFVRQNLPFEAETVRIEGGDPRGLALLLARGPLPERLTALPLAPQVSLGGGERTTVIGFPQGGGPWAVARADVVSRVGRDVTLAGPIDEGNSGGPVVLDGAVVAVVTGINANFALAAPAAIAQLTLEGWGVTPAAPRVVDAPPPAPEATRRTAPAPAAAPTGSGHVQIRYQTCEKLRSGTSFRVTLRGQAQGPAGASVRVALAVGDDIKSTPKVSCDAWQGCRRQANAPPETGWSISTIVLLPMPDVALVTLASGDAPAGTPPHALERVELDCRNW